MKLSIIVGRSSNIVLAQLYKFQLKLSNNVYRKSILLCFVCFSQKYLPHRDLPCGHSLLIYVL